MNTPERRAESLKLKRQCYLEHPMTSRYAAMFAAPTVDQPISDENSVQEDSATLSHTNARDPAEPGLDTMVDVQQALIRNDRVPSDSEMHEAQSLESSRPANIRNDRVSSNSETHETQSLESLRPANIRNDGVSSDSETHEAQSAEPAIIHFSLPQVPKFNIATEETEVSRRTKEDKKLFDSDCVRTRTPNDIDNAGGTRGELQNNAGGVYVESREEKEARNAYLIGSTDLTGIVGVEISGRYLSVNNKDTDIKSQDSRRPYLVLGLLSTSTSIPKEEMIRIKKSSHLFKELHEAASKLRPWPIRILSLKSESGFAIYECTKQGIHSRVRVDQSTQDILTEMFSAYNSGRRDVHSQWLSFVHKELNNMGSNPRLGTHSLQLILSWSALKLVIWGSTPILLSLFIGFWYMFKSHPGEDPVAIVQTAWGISSYIVTAGARKYYPQSGHASFHSNSKIVAIAILAAVTQIG
jgi:hypothetical protein